MDREPLNESAPVAAPRAVTGADYLSRIARRTAWRLWWLLLPGVLLVAAGLLFDLRLSIVGFMLLLVVFPMVITTAVLGSATRPAVVARTRVNSVLLGAASVTLLDEESAALVTVPYERFLSVRRSPRFVEIVFGASPSDILLLPVDLLSDSDIRHLASRVHDDSMMM